MNLFALILLRTLCSLRVLVGTAFFFCMVLFAHAKPVEIILWHSMAGTLGKEIDEITNNFNKSQADYQVKPIYKGEYLESLTSFAAAFRAHQPPALIQVSEVGKATMLAPKGIIKPVDELMREQGLVLPEASFFGVVRAHYSENGQLMAMPFNISVPVIFYNADVLKKMGYTFKNFPRTWDAFEILAAKLRQAGFSCAYTSAYPAWILMESFAAIHGLAMINAQNGQAIYNNKEMVNHLARLVQWQKLHYFEYGGRADNATILFTSGQCPLFSQSSGAYRSLSSLLPFSVGVAALPWDEKSSAQRYPNIIGGGALWVVAGQSPSIYQGIARFFVYLAQPAVQRQWNEKTGYFPLGLTGIYAQLATEIKQPLLRVAQAELNVAQGKKEITLSIQNQIRHLNDQALEAIFAKIKTPQQAMDDAVKRANHALARFKRNTQEK